MKKIFLFAVIVIALGLTSCKKKCDCSQSWDQNKVYVEGDRVGYNGKCWKAVIQGRGIVPGPWMQNGNDIWEEECSD